MSYLKNNYDIEKDKYHCAFDGRCDRLELLSKFGIADRVPHVEKVVTLGVPFNDTEVGKDGKEIEYRPLTQYGPLTMAPLFSKIKSTAISSHLIRNF